MPKAAAVSASTAAVTGLVLSGGGSRGAYQAGAIHALTTIAAQDGYRLPLSVLSGVSAGAINAAYLAANATDLAAASAQLADRWRTITTAQVFRTDVCALANIGFDWFKDLLTGGLTHWYSAKALLDTTPLYNFLQEGLVFDGIKRNIAAGNINGLAITAINYATSDVISFYETNRDVAAWCRRRRCGLPAHIGIQHVMASAAIPLFFPSVPIGEHFFGDGSLRNVAPLSSAIHLGANRLMVIGVRHLHVPAAEPGPHPPALSMARVLSVLMTAILLDGTDTDVERLLRINQTVRLLGASARASYPLREIALLYLHPSEDIARIALNESGRLPKIMRYLLEGLGPAEDAAELISYLFFEPAFCSRLVDLGYEDTMRRRDEVRTFLYSKVSKSGLKKIHSE